MIRINLLPPRIRQTKGVQKIYTYIILGLAGAAAVLILVLVNLLVLLQRTEARIAQARTAQAQLADKLSYLQTLTAREAKAQQLRGLIRNLLPRQALWISFLDEMADLIPGDLWLTQVLPRAQTAAGQLDLLIEGEGYTKISVAEFLAALEDSGRFNEVQLLALTDMKTGNASQVKFKVNLKYAPATLEAGGKL